MDILNFLNLRTQRLVKTTANNPETDLIVLGADVGFQKRDDRYQTYAMPLADAVKAGSIANNTFETTTYDIFPFVITPFINKSDYAIIDTNTGSTLQAWTIQGTILLTGYNSYAEPLGTIVIEGGATSDIQNWKTSGAVSFDSFLPGVTESQPLGLINLLEDSVGGADYAQISIGQFPTVVGANLEIDVVMFVGSCPITSGPAGTFEGEVSFQIEFLADANYNVTLN
jgi:hypothetical protein